MPIQVKTMRDVWDRKRKGEKETEVKKRKILPPEMEKHYLDYLARKKAFSEGEENKLSSSPFAKARETKDEMVKAFAEYEKKLGGAGFSKI